MLAIKLSRTGKKKQPYFRIIVVEKQRDPWGKHLEIVGNVNPRTKERVINVERVKYWLAKGAQPTDTIWNMLVQEKIVEGKKRSVTTISKKREEKAKKKEEKAK